MDQDKDFLVLVEMEKDKEGVLQRRSSKGYMVMAT